MRDDRVTPLLLDALHDPLAQVRQTAAEVFGDRGERRAVGPLTALLADSDAAVCLAAIHALAKLGHRPSVPEFVAPLRGRFDHRTQITVLAAVCRISRPEQQGIAALVGYLADDDELVREMVADALKDWREAVPALVARLEVGEQRERRLVIGLLAEWVVRDMWAGLLAQPDGRADAELALSALRAHVRDEDAAIRATVIETLGVTSRRHIRDDAVLNAVLLEALDEGDTGVRKAAAYAAGARRDAHAVPKLIGMLGDPRPSIRCHAVDALAGIGDRQAVEPLRRLLGDTHTPVRQHTAGALLRMSALPDADRTLLARERTDADVSGGDREHVALPDALRRAVAAALDAVRVDPAHYLAPALRRPIYDGFGSRLDAVANRARGLLALSSVRRVLPVYERTRIDWSPRDEMEMGEDVLEGMVARSDARWYLHGVTGAHGPFAEEVGRAARFAYDAGLLALEEVVGYNGIDGAKFWLNPVTLAYSHGFDARETRVIQRMVEAHQALLEGAWNDYFGSD